MKPSFGQVLGYIQEGEPLALDLPNRKASIYTSSHWFLDDYPNAPEPLSKAPMPHTTLNPAAAFETADEGYEGVPFPRPPREFTRPSFLPNSDDGGTDPGQALRNDGLNPPRPPTLGGRMRESGIQAAEAIVAGGAAGAAAAVRSVSVHTNIMQPLYTARHSYLKYRATCALKRDGLLLTWWFEHREDMQRSKQDAKYKGHPTESNRHRRQSIRNKGYSTTKYVP